MQITNSPFPTRIRHYETSRHITQFKFADGPNLKFWSLSNGARNTKTKTLRNPLNKDVSSGDL
jgi:hypothetical protein